MTSYSSAFTGSTTKSLQLTDSSSIINAVVNANGVSRAYSIAAAGTTQATATQLTAVINEIDTVASSTGVNLPSSSGSTNTPFSFCIVINNGANAVNVYAFKGSSDTINGTAGATGVSQAAGSTVLYTSAKAGAWFSSGAGENANFTNLTVSGALSLGATGYITPSPLAYYPTAVTAAAGTTLSAAEMAGSVVIRTGPSAAFTDTTDTAANILALLNGVIPIGGAFGFFLNNNTDFTETLQAGLGVTISGNPIIAANSSSFYIIEPTSASAVTIQQITTNSNTVQNAQYVTGTTTTTFAAGQLTGSAFTVYTNTGATPGSIATRTATQMIADMPFGVVTGTSWMLRVINGQGTGTLTITAGLGVTLTGLGTIAANTWRDFVCVVTNAGTPAITMTDAGVGTYS